MHNKLKKLDSIQQPIRLRHLTFETTPIRPLGALSDFVRSTLPTESPRLGDALPMLPTRKALKSLEPGDAKVALLDLKMLFVAASRHPTPHLVRDAFADRIELMNALLGSPPVTQMTYQEIVLNNPPADLRVFTPGRLGDAERRFYRGHQLIEESLAYAIFEMQEASRNPQNALICLQGALIACNRVVEGMRSFMTDLERDEFMGFKPFFDTNPYTGEKGPSGAFSAKVPHVDILLYGHETPGNILDYLYENKKYFPQQDHHNAARCFVEGKSLMGASEGEAKDMAMEISKAMLNFRRFHHGAVVSKIGKNAVGSAEGTDASSYLQKRLDAFRELLDKHRPKR